MSRLLTQLKTAITGGSSSCANPQGADLYGRFASYFPAFEFYLTGAGCAYQPDEVEKYIGANGGEYALGLNSKGTCAWTATSLSSWLQITAGSNGSGSGTIRYNAEPNPGSELRIGFLNVAGQIVAVTQTGNGNHARRNHLSRIEIASNRNFEPRAKPFTFVEIRNHSPSSKLPFTARNRLSHSFGICSEDLTVLVTDANGYPSVGQIKVESVAPALFSAQANGKGVAAAVIQRVKGDVHQYEPVAEQRGAEVVHKAIDLGTEEERVYLLLYGTGIRSRYFVSPLKARIGDLELEVD